MKKIGKLHVSSPSPSRRLRPTCINHEALSTADSEVGVQKRHLSLGSGHGGGRTRAGVQERPANPPAMCLHPTGQCGVLQSQTATATMLRTSYCQVRRLSNARTRWQGRGEGWVAVERDTINESYVPSRVYVESTGIQYILYCPHAGSLWRVLLRVCILILILILAGGQGTFR